MATGEERDSARTRLQSSRRGILGLAGGAGAALAGLAFGRGARAAAAGDEIAGSWLVQWTSPRGRRFTRLLALTADGIVIEAKSPIEPAAPETGRPSEYNSAGLGQWTRLGGRRYAFTVVALVTDANDTLLGQERETVSLEYESGSDTWSGGLRYTELDAEGAVVATRAEVPIRGRRIGVPFSE